MTAWLLWPLVIVAWPLTVVLIGKTIRYGRGRDGGRS